MANIEVKTVAILLIVQLSAGFFLENNFYYSDEVHNIPKVNTTEREYFSEKVFIFLLLERYNLFNV